MSTPEAKVKDQVKKILKEFKPQLYAHWPVQYGMGEPTLDCNGAICGRAFAIETKAPGKFLTPMQEQTMRKMTAAGVRVFIVDGGEMYSYAALRHWLEYWAARGMVEDGVL